MTLAQVRSLVRTLLLAVGKADVDQRTLDMLLDGINKSLWLRAVKEAQSMFTIFQDVTVAVNAEGSYDLASLVSPTTIHRVVKVELRSSSGIRIPLTPITQNDRGTYDAQTIIATQIEPSTWYTARSDSTLSEMLFLVPRPNKDVQLRIHFVPNIADWSTDAAEALDGHATFAPLHLLIALEAAVALGAVNVAALRDRMDAQFGDTIRKRHGQGGRKVHYEPYE